MKILTSQECAVLCKQVGLPSDESDIRSVFGDGDLEVTAAIPQSVTKQEYWAKVLFELLGRPNRSLIWFTEWNTLSKDGSLLCLIDGYRKAKGENRAMDQAPGHCFEASELSEACGLIRFVMAFEWGAYLASFGERPIAIIINDCFLKIKCKDIASFREVQKHLSQTGEIIC